MIKQKLMNFSYVGETKLNPQDGLYYVLEYSTRDIPTSSEFKRKTELKIKQNKKWKNKSNQQK